MEECGSMQEIISMLRRIIESGVLPRDIGYGLGALGMMLTCDGMVRLDSLGGWKIDIGSTRKIIELLHSLYRLRKPENIFNSGSNVEAKTWVQNIFTFHNEILNMKKSLKYGILPIPLAKDAVVCVQPTFLGIKAKQRNLPECLSLAEYLCSEKIQRRFCAAGTGIFSRAKLLNETDTMAPLKIPCAELKKLMSNSSIMFSEKDSGMMESLYRIGLDMIEDLIPPDEVMRRIELLRH